MNLAIAAEKIIDKKGDCTGINCYECPLHWEHEKRGLSFCSELHDKLCGDFFETRVKWTKEWLKQNNEAKMTENPYKRYNPHDVKKGRRTVIGLAEHKTLLTLEQRKREDAEQCVNTLKALVAKNEEDIARISEALNAKDEILNSRDAQIKQLEALLEQERKEKAVYTAEVRRTNLLVNKLIGWKND